MIGASSIVLGALKKVGSWVLSNPNIALNAVDKVVKIQTDKKSINIEERIQVVEEKVNQVGAATLELDLKIDNEITSLHNELIIARKQIRTLKIMMLCIGTLLCAGVIASVLIAVL